LAPKLVWTTITTTTTTTHGCQSDVFLCAWGVARKSAYTRLNCLINTTLTDHPSVVRTDE
jgi:hypothetical protein